jgi:heat shock protein HslJ
MTRVTIVAALLALAACNQPAKEEASASNEAVPAAEPAPAIAPALDGEWRLTKLDGKPVDGMGMTFGGGRAKIAAGCNHRAWAFTQNRNIVSFTADPAGSGNCADTPDIDQESAFHAIDRATMAIFAKEGREASLSGNGGNVTLERR